MTREEAIKVLEMFLFKQCDLERTKFAYDDNTVWDAVKMASEALEQEPCEDTVRREDVLTKLRFWCGHYDGIYRAIDEIKELPSVQPTPVYFPPCVDCHKKMDEIRRVYDKLMEQKAAQT